MNILTQVHGNGRACQFKHYEQLFRQFANQELPFMLVKTMATPRRDCAVPYQASFYADEESMREAYSIYTTQKVRENGLDVMFVTAFEWDLGINFIPYPIQ